MKKLICLITIVLLFGSIADAFLYNIKILSKEEIASLTNEQLVDVYTEAKIEEKASKEFHEGAGFSSSKDYDKRKKIMRYIVDLRREMSKREVSAEPIDEWLR